MSLMVYRKKRTPSSLPKSKGQGPTFDREGTKESDRSMDDKKNTSSMGLRWFSVGSTSKSGDNNYDEDDYQDAGKYRSGARDTKRSGDMEKQLFEGFESSVILEDYAPAHQPVHPLDWKPDGHQHSRRASAEIGPAGDIEFIARASRKPSVDVVSDSGRCSMQQEELSEISAPLPGVQGSTSLASKIGQKLSHLRVKTYLLQPNHHRSFEGPDAIAPAMPPVSPISPMSPASISSSSTSSPTKMGLGSFPSEARRRSDHDIAISLGTAIERDPASATPSFSLATAPVPGTASNRRAQSITTSKHILREMPSLERFQSQDGAIYHSIDYGPPSPISPTNHFASQGLPNQGNRQNQHQYARHQKEHRSNLIKDLILQAATAAPSVPATSSTASSLLSDKCLIKQPFPTPTKQQHDE
ncbi:hypothetical protein BGX28_002290 [Mortierella sp. GBA30]|nr:hypothetical protein BGX28_002290 [Mortierella sp. GBA30]